MTTLRKILVVDDDPVVGRSFDRVLSKRGYAVVTAGDGAEALRKIAAEGVKRRLVGLELEGGRIARQGYSVASNGKAVGEVTSGTMSPTLKKSIAMAYVDADRAAEGASVEVDFRGSTIAANVVRLPFYKRTTPKT